MLPKALLSSLVDVDGFDEDSFVKTHEIKESITSIRLNSNKLKHEHEIEKLVDDFDKKVETKKVAWSKNGYYLSQRPFFTHHPLLHAGAFYVQEASSMFLYQILEQVIANDTQKLVLDLCAAPGGKSTLLLDYFKNGLVVSNEVIKQRSHVLVENITKWGSANTIVTNNDATHFKVLEQVFDIMVIDAPCSGSGLFRKDEKAIEEWSEDNVNLCSQRQQRILADTIDCLKKDGILIYSTCSYSTKENEEIVDWLLQNFQLESVEITLEKQWNIVETQSQNKKGFGYRFYPNKVEGEGFFVAVFKQKNVATNQHKIKENILTKISKNEQEVLNSFINLNDEFFIFKHQDNIRVFPKHWTKELQLITQHLYIKKAGVAAGSIKNKDLIPDHEIAMTDLELKLTKKIPLNKQQALQYLSKKEVIIDTDFVGWALFQFNNVNLGWSKVLKNRINNYYPTEWRILNTNFLEYEKV